MESTINLAGVNSNNIFNLELFFNMSPDLLCIAGFDGFFKKINPTVSKTLGYTDEELFAQPINSFVYDDDKDITSFNRDNIRKDQPLLNFENRYVTKSGEIVWLSWTSMPIKSQKLVFAIAKNITHKKRQEEDRNAQLADLTKINHDLKQLTYTTSHDLRLPVSNLLSVFGMMDVSKIQDLEIREFIEVLKSATENLKDTLNNYIDTLSHKNILSAYVEELDLDEQLDLVSHSLGSLIQSSKAQITADFSGLRTVKFNKAYLESIFLNLITNSIKYARPGFVPVINILAKQEGGIKQLIFADEGMGFDLDKVKDKIFGLNQKFHDHTDSKGIGLYLVYNHVISLGDHIAIESKVNAGTKFIISFRD